MEDKYKDLDQEGGLTVVVAGNGSSTLVSSPSYEETNR